MLRYLVIGILFCQYSILTSADRTRSYYFPGSYCSSRMIEVDGVILRSSSNSYYSDSSCVMRFSADDSLFTSKRLMINFERYSISDCSVGVKIFYGPHEDSSPDVVLNCHSVKPSILYSTGKYVTLQLNKTSSPGYDFEIVMTAFKQTTSCFDFRCTSGKCIDDDLRCDGTDNCFDNSDEMSCFGHRHYRRRHGGSRVVMIPGIVSVLVFVTMASVIVIVCRRRGWGRFSMAGPRGAPRGQLIALQPASRMSQPINIQQTMPPDYSTATQMPYPTGAAQPSFPAAYPPAAYHGQPMMYPTQPTTGYYPMQAHATGF